MNDVLSVVNNPQLEPQERLAALCTWNAGVSGPKPGDEVNNHIHTVFSFSPYTPAMAAFKAREAGLGAAGSVDHDSAAAAEEMIAACAELGIGGCSGFEIRVSFKRRPDGSPCPLARRKINNPDSEGYAYITVQGIPSPAREKTAAFLKPVRETRLRRSKEMAAAASLLLQEGGLAPIGFDQDVLEQSLFSRGGEVTERHLMAAAASKLIEKYRRGPELPGGLRRSLGIVPSPKTEKLLSDPSNPHYFYDLLGVLKTDFLPRFFIQPGETECIPAKTAADFALSIGAVPAYSYLGDVGESPTGDKKAEKFEDDYLEELFEEIRAAGFRAITYMPPRNTPAQLERIQRFCFQGGYMEISGVDINSSRQSFNCPEVLSESCRHLTDTTWALIAHERLASVDISWSLFSPGNSLSSLSLEERLTIYTEAGKSLDLRRPEESALRIIEELRKGRTSWNQI